MVKMDLLFTINNDKFKKARVTDYPNKSNNYLRVLIDFITDDWVGLTKFLILRNSNHDAYQLHYAEEGVKLPVDVVRGDFFYITVYGADNEDEVRITTNELLINLKESGYTKDIKDLEDYPEDIWSQIFEGIDSKSDVDHKHNIGDVIDFPLLSEVATTGEYDDLKGKPSIPVNVSDLVNDSDFVDETKLSSTIEWIESTFITKSDTNGLVRNDGTIDTTPYLSEHQDISMKADKTYVDNKIIDIKEYVDETIGNIKEDMLL